MAEAPMRLTIRTDAGPEIGGGHLMRCLTLAQAARARGHHVHFVMAESDQGSRVRAAGFQLTELAPLAHEPEPAPPHAHWCAVPWAVDARATADIPSDWLILDHYGLDARWIAALRARQPGLRVLALDDLDDRPLDADLVLDPARLVPTPRRYPVRGTLDGPSFALLRPEFAALRDEALTRRGAAVRRALILPGLYDAAGLAPRALDALEAFDLEAEVVMGSRSQSLGAVTDRIAARPGWTLTLDATDMARRMVDADICIGAGGGTAWERCALGLPTLAVAVADNQVPGVAALAEAGAVIGADLSDDLAPKIAALIERAPDLSAKAAALADGHGATRVLDALTATLHPIGPQDAQLLFDWRNQPHIRAVSHNTDPLDWTDHKRWLAQTLRREDGLWCVYGEGRPLGFVGAHAVKDGRWRWSFYIGAGDAPRGAGGRMLAAMLRRLQRDGRASEIEGEVRVGNAASIALHLRLGFAEVISDRPGTLVFRRSL